MKNRKELLEKIGERARNFRQLSGILLNDICYESGYTPSTVNAFERGDNNNAIILLAYIRYGFNPRKEYKNL